MKLQGFYPKILELIKENSQNIKKYESQGTECNQQIKTTVQQLEKLKTTTSGGVEQQKNQYMEKLKNIQKQLDEIKQSILNLNNKNSLLDKRISFLKNLESTECPPASDIQDLLWYSEVFFYTVTSSGKIPTLNKIKSMDAVEAQDIVELLTQTLALPCIGSASIRPDAIRYIIERMASLPQKQAILAISKLNEIKEQYCKGKKEQVIAYFNELYETINQKVAIVPSAPFENTLSSDAIIFSAQFEETPATDTVIPNAPFAETFLAAAAEDLSEEPSLEEESDEEFHDTNEGYEEELQQSVELGLRAMSMWKEQNEQKSKFISEKTKASVEARDLSTPFRGL